jgi:hypothetical protein
MAYSDYDDSHQECSLKFKCPLRDPHMLRISFRMEVEQCVIIKFLRFKGMKLRDIHHELTEVFGEEAYTLASIKRWIHELKTSRTIMTDDPRPRRPSIHHIDVLILKQLSGTPFASVRSLSEDLKIPKTTVWRWLTESLQFKSRHFK